MSVSAGLARGLLFFLMPALLLPGCASAPKERGQSGTAPVARQSDPAPGLPARTGPSPGQTPPAVPAPPAAQVPPAAPPAKPAAPRSAAAEEISPRARMLQSAGREPSATQPEAGFTLRLPDAIGDGEAFLVEFGAEGAQKLHVEWRGRSVGLGPCSDSLCQALLPVNLDETAKNMPLAMTVTWANGKKERFAADMPVKKRKYPVQRLTVDQKFVTPPPEMREKIKKDREELRAAVSKFTSTRYWNLPFLRPVPGEVTSLYGMRRVFNNQPKNPHKGVDFDAREGDPIAALEDGVVVLVSNHYYSGNIVIIDHGLGVLSSYLHMSGFAVSEGQKVSRGDTIGYIGSTGRVTGPHLHLSLYVLGVSVNAATCIAM